MNLSQLTGFANKSAITGVTADGTVAGNLASVEIGKTGQVNAVLDNGERTNIGTIALALFGAPVELERSGDNRYLETDKSGAAQAATPGTAGRGSLQSKALENSIVDPTNEFTSLIRYQRAYQAGSKVVSTVSDMLNTAIRMS